MALRITCCVSLVAFALCSLTEIVDCAGPDISAESSPDTVSCSSGTCSTPTSTVAHPALRRTCKRARTHSVCGHTGAFNFTLAERLMSFCKAVYTIDGAALRAWSCVWCRRRHADFQLHSVIYSRRLNTKAAVGFDPTLNATVLMFRGTTLNDEDADKKNKNWLLVNLNGGDLANLSCEASRLGRDIPGRIYCGFYTAYLEQRDEMLAAVRWSVALHRRAPLYVTGHSLGGALAALAALDVRVRRVHARAPVLVTFGAPHVGDHALAGYFACRVRDALRVFNRWDIVPASLGVVRWMRHVGKALQASDTFPLRKKSLVHTTYLGINTAENI